MDPNQNFPASILSNRTGFDPFSPPTLMPSAPRVDTRFQTDVDLGGDVYHNANKGFGMGGSATDRIRAFRKAYQESRDPLGTNPAVPQQPEPQFRHIDASPTRYLR